MVATARVVASKKTFAERDAARLKHVLVVLPPAEQLPPDSDWPGIAGLSAVLDRKGKLPAELAKEPLAVNEASGCLVVWLMVDGSASAFERQVLLRRAMMLLLEEQPEEVGIAVAQSHPEYAVLVRESIYVAQVNGVRLPEYKSQRPGRSLKRIVMFSPLPAASLHEAQAMAVGNLLARSLTVTPPNLLDPRAYRRRIRALAEERGWEVVEYDVRKLRKMGAGAFVAVAQGSHDDAAIVHLRRKAKRAGRHVALVGKGICFDTGGHNLKPARYMRGMHEDMNGSAVALGILLAADELELPVNLDVWLAIARNHLGPEAYTQNDVVTALNGTTIEIVHTDAEGRMVLADALTMAAREKPDQLLDFATLTGSMVTALGTRYSGVLGNRPELCRLAVEIGQQSGERVCVFPLDADYDDALDSKVADVLQCTLEGEADHILAARFLQRFVEDTPWLHMDLSACNCKDGLGAVASDVTGFGVAWGVAWLQGPKGKHQI